MATTLVVNPGSSSRKYALYCDGSLAFEVSFEDTKNGYELSKQIIGEQQSCEKITADDFAEAFNLVANLTDQHLSRIGKGRTLEQIVVRVVAPGSFFQKHAIINKTYLTKLKEKTTSAPLHIPAILRELNYIFKRYPKTKTIAASDSAFHKDIPFVAREYSILRADTEQFDIHRFGYHGLSVASVVRRVDKLIACQAERMIVCHIGSGTSITAVLNGVSVETTMGFAPATGLPMSSRAGDIDEAALLELMKCKNLSVSDAETYVNTCGGLTGLSGDSDIRRLLDKRALNDQDAAKALNFFAYHIRKAIAAQTVALGGLDVLVFTATAAFRSTELRALILENMSYLGINFSTARNDLMVGKEGVISTKNSPVKIAVIRTDEMGEMARVGLEVSSGS